MRERLGEGVTMAGILDGLRVLDLSWGAAGPMATMLLGDHGAQVTKVEPPGGDPFRGQAAYTVWNRGKRSVILDLKQDADRERFIQLAEDADVLIESFSPGTTTRLGIDEPTMRGHNPRLIYCSITGYGREGPLADRPAYDALVAARSGSHWEQRGHYGTTMAHIKGLALQESPWPVPPGVEQTAHSEGPAFLAVPFPSVTAAILAVLGISAALRERELSGRGQWVETSLLQGVMMAYVSTWQRVTDPLQPGYRLPYFDRRNPKGIFQTGDGQWIHQMGVDDQFLRAAAAVGGDPDLPPRARRGAQDGGELPPYEEILERLAREYAITVEAVKKLPRDMWVDILARGQRAGQPILSPEEALLGHPEWVAEGSIAEVDDPVHGTTRQAGIIYGFSEYPTRVRRDAPAPAAGQHTDIVLRELASRVPDRGSNGEHVAAPTRNAASRGPLTGIRVLDFGLAVAGPFGPQLLGDLGADVIKVSNVTESYTGNVPLQCHRGKRCIGIDLKTERGLEIAYQLVKTADVAHHNMRYAAAERLRIDYESLREINPGIVYCHTRAFEANGPRTSLPGNDQMGNALAGTEYELGATHHGKPPVWHNTAWGDLGNGALSAIAVAQALYARERTGKGQFVDTSILNGALFCNTYTFAKTDGTPTERPRIDAELKGMSALYRLFKTSDEWICIAAHTEAHWQALCAAIGQPELSSDERFATAQDRLSNDAALIAILEPVLAGQPAAQWISTFDAVGVPAEISSRSFVQEMFDDPTLIDQQWVASYPHPAVGTLEQAGVMVQFSETPSRILGPAPLVGQHSREILSDSGVRGRRDRGAGARERSEDRRSHYRCRSGRRGKEPRMRSAYRGAVASRIALNVLSERQLAATGRPRA